MSRPKALANSGAFTVEEGSDSEALAEALRSTRLGAIVPVPANPPEAVALLVKVAKLIAVRNQNGSISDKFCLLCKESRRLRQPCVHGQLWAIARSVDQTQ